MQDKKMIILYVVLGVVGFIVVGVIGYNLLFASSPIVVSDFANKTVAEVDIWAKENDITVEYSYVYDETIESGLVISQSVAKDTEIKKGSSITITLSQGADPNLQITLPDFTGYTYDQLVTYVTENKLTDVTYDYVENDKIATDVFISHNITTPTMKRSDMIIFTVSLGKNEETTEITVPDFSTYTKTAISNWGTANNVIIKYVTATSKTIDTGGFIKQSLAAGTITYARRRITITYSSGKPVEAINFTGMTEQEVTNWVNALVGHNIEISDRKKIYNNDFANNVVISSNAPSSGTLADGARISLNISLGKPNVTSYVGQDYSSLTSQVSTLNNSGAKLEIKAHPVSDNEIAKGKIISQDKSGEISTGSKIIVYYSTGKSYEILDYSNKNESELTAFINSTNGGILKGTKTEQYDNSVPSNKIISNSKANTTVEEGTTINYSISIGKPSVTDYTGQSYSSLESQISTLNSKGASIKLSFTTEYSYTVSSGKIISQSTSGEVYTGTEITGKYSSGLKFDVGDYTNSNESTLITFIDSTDGKITKGTKTEQFSNTIDIGKVISHSYKGQTANEGSVIDYVVSKGPSGYVRSFSDLYEGGKDPATVKIEIETELTRLGFTNVNIKIADNPDGTSRGAVYYQNHVRETSLSAEINIYIQE